MCEDCGFEFFLTEEELIKTLDFVKCPECGYYILDDGMLVKESKS